jgi:predicted DNA-binding transcriptional regulator AlpA
MARRIIRRRAARQRPQCGDSHPQLSLAMEFPSIPHDSDLRLVPPSRARGVKLRILRMRDVVSLTGVHRATIHRWIQAGSFPAKDAPRHRPTGWLEETYERWVRGSAPPFQRPTDEL